MKKICIEWYHNKTNSTEATKGWREIASTGCSERYVVVTTCSSGQYTLGIVRLVGIWGGAVALSAILQTVLGPQGAI